MLHQTRQWLAILCQVASLALFGCAPVRQGLDSLKQAPPRTASTSASAAVSAPSPCFESGCHADLKSHDEAYVHEPYRNNLCLDCHKTYHTEQTQRLYLQSDIDLCYTCHAGAKLGSSHPVGQGVIDPNTGQMMTCTSTCHQSHSAPYPYLLRLPPGGELCMSCHEEFIQP